MAKRLACRFPAQRAGRGGGTGSRLPRVLTSAGAEQQHAKEKQAYGKEFSCVFHTFPPLGQQFAKEILHISYL